jgi:hypothetical protein
MLNDGQLQLNQITDSALRSHVVISSLDPKGLANLMREADASQRGFMDPSLSGAAVDSQRESLVTGVLSEVAEDTGGEYFHNHNDLGAGFGALSGSPDYYTLAFKPSDLKQDDRFHELKVTLAVNHKGFHIQARSGYFAVSEQGKAADAESRDSEATSAQAATTSAPTTSTSTHELLRAALYAKTDVALIAVTLNTKTAEGQGEMRELTMSSHLDGKDLPFRKDEGNSLNTVIFLFAVFDTQGDLVTFQQRHVDIKVLDGHLSDFYQGGVDEGTTFQVKPGTYRLREVVMDAEEHHLTSFSRDVIVP